MQKRKNKKKKPYFPEFVSVLDSNGVIKQIKYTDVIEHEEYIIDDNIEFGICNNYSKKEVDEYAKPAESELRALKQKIRENPSIVLKFDKTTERFVPVERNKEGHF